MNSSNRDPGQLVFSSNIERQVEAPLDASMLVRTASALTDPNTFKSINDGNDYSFPGMIVAVIDDVDDYKNGLYILKNLPRANPDNWVQFQPAYDNRLKTKSTHIVSSINELRSSAIAFLKEHNDEYDIAIDQLNATTKRLDTNIDQLKGHVFTTINTLDTKVDENYTTLFEKITNNQSANSITQDEQRTDINVLRGNLINAESRIDTHGIDIGYLRTDVNTISNIIIPDHVKTLSLMIDSGVSTLNSKVDTVNSTLTTDINALSGNLINAKNRINTLELSTIPAVESDISYLSGVIVSNNNDINAKADTVNSTLTTKVNALSTEIYTNLQTRDETLSSMITGKVSALNLKIDDCKSNLNDQIDNIEEDIETLSTVTIPNIEDNINTVSDNLTISSNTLLTLTQDNFKTLNDKFTNSDLQLHDKVDVVSANVDSVSDIVDSNIYYSNNEPTPTTIGGISANTRFENKTPIIDILNDLLYPETTPILTLPSCSINGTSTQVEVGKSHTINVSVTFNEGSIKPVYGENGKYIIDSAPWAGDVTKYTYSINDSELTPGDECDIAFTTYTITGSAEHEAGKYNQYTSKGTLVTKNASGIVSSNNNIQITGTAPYFATTNDITKLTRADKQISPATTHVEVNMMSEDLTNKQAILVPKFWLGNSGKPSQIQQYDTASKTWNKISTNSFTITEFDWNSKDKTDMIDGEQPYAVEKKISDFSKYVYIKHNSETTGARQLKIYN